MTKDFGALVEVAAELFGPLRWVLVFLFFCLAIGREMDIRYRWKVVGSELGYAKFISKLLNSVPHLDRDSTSNKSQPYEATAS